MGYPGIYSFRTRKHTGNPSMRRLVFITLEMKQKKSFCSIFARFLLFVPVTWRPVGNASRTPSFPRYLRVSESIELLEVLLQHEQQQTAARLAHGDPQRAHLFRKPRHKRLCLFVVLFLVELLLLFSSCCCCLPKTLPIKLCLFNEYKSETLSKRL